MIASAVAVANVHGQASPLLRISSMPRVIPFLLALLSLPLLAFQPVPPPGRTVGTPVREPQFPSIAAVGSDGDGFLVALTDGRYGQRDVLGVRYDREGRLLDQEAFPIAATWRNDTLSSRPLWNGTEYMVFTAADSIGTYRQRVHRDGSVESHGAIPEHFLDVVWSGSRYAALHSMGGALRLRISDPSLQTGDETAVAPDGWGWIGSNGSQLLVLRARWDLYNYHLTARVFDEHGSPLTAEQPLWSKTYARWQSPEFEKAAISWNGTRFLVTWPYLDTIYAAFVSPAGAVQELSFPGKPAAGTSVGVAWDGFAHLIAWSESPSFEARGTLIASDGTILETLDLGVPSQEMSVASNGEVFFVATSRDRIIVRSTGENRVSAPEPLSFSFAEQRSAAMSANTSNLFVAWEENQKIFASRLSPRGEPLDGRGIEIGAGYFTSISTSSTERTHLAVWSNNDHKDYRFARVTSDGQRLEPPGGAPIDGHLVATDGTSFLIVGRASSHAPMIATRVPERGGPATPIVLNSIDGRAVALVRFHGTYALLSATGEEARIHLLDDDGKLLRTAAIAPHDGLMAAAAAGDGLLVAFVREGGTEMFVRRIDRDLTAGPEIPVYSGAGPFHARLTLTPKGFLLAVSVVSEAQLIQLDENGTPANSPRVRKTNALVWDAVHAFGSTWMAVGRGWRPLPESHAGMVSRIYLEELTARRRAVTP